MSGSHCDIGVGEFAEGDAILELAMMTLRESIEPLPLLKVCMSNSSSIDVLLHTQHTYNTHTTHVHVHVHTRIHRYIFLFPPFTNLYSYGLSVSLSMIKTFY